MIDREKVIKGLEHCDFGGSGTCYKKECPYYQSNDCTDELKNDILVLLKEQEEKSLQCDKCRYHREDGWCGMLGQWVKETDYCSLGAWKGQRSGMIDEERERKIHEALHAHHDKVKEKYHTVMTVLCGSQNYRLDTESSDYDTFTFVLPSLADMAMLKEPVSTMTEDEYGHIEIKDIRLALNLLKKTSPNSVEWFATRYRIVEPEYADLFDTYITPETLRCSTKHMMAAIGGLAYQLTKRNIPPGKRYSHLLRMNCMVDNYYNLQSDILSLTELERNKALKAKMLQNMPFYDGKCFECEQRIEEKIELYSGVDMSEVEKLGMSNVSELQVKLFKVLISK